MYITASKVTTMELGKIMLSLPVPKVLVWSAASQNPVESEYIVMEEASGSQPHTIWSELELRRKQDIIDQNCLSGEEDALCFIQQVGQALTIEFSRSLKI
jgi:hypothetical protein